MLRKPPRVSYNNNQGEKTPWQYPKRKSLNPKKICVVHMMPFRLPGFPSALNAKNPKCLTVFVPTVAPIKVKRLLNRRKGKGLPPWKRKSL
jgi:hypothetical protein